MLSAAGHRRFYRGLRAARAGGGGEIRWALVEGFVGHQREGEGFFGVVGDAELRRKEEFDLATVFEERAVARGSSGELGEDQGLRAPPPETMSWWILCLGRTKRWRASTMERL